MSRSSTGTMRRGISAKHHVTPQTKAKATPSRKSVFARQRERAEAVLEFLQVRRERSDAAREKAIKAAREERLKRRQARGYDLPRATIVSVARPYTVTVDRDRSLRGKDRIRARKAARR